MNLNPSIDYLCLLLTQARKSLKYSGVTIGTQLARQFATCKQNVGNNNNDDNNNNNDYNNIIIIILPSGIVE